MVFSFSLPGKEIKLGLAERGNNVTLLPQIHQLQYNVKILYSVISDRIRLNNSEALLMLLASLIQFRLFCSDQI